VPPVNQNLGQLPYFSGITSTGSEISQNGGHVFFIRSSADGTDIIGYHMNTLNGKKDSPTTKIGAKETFPDVVDLFLFGLFSEGIVL
jgi:hypothetical protein